MVLDVDPNVPPTVLDAIRSMLHLRSPRCDMHLSYFSLHGICLAPYFLDLLPLVCFVTSVLLTYCCLLRPSKVVPQDNIATTGSRKALQSLLTVITPTRSLWPPTYLQIARDAMAARNQTFNLPLSALLEDVISGKIEFRNPELHLPELIGNTLQQEGWKIRLRLDFRWQLRVLRGALASRFNIQRRIMPPTATVDGREAAFSDIGLFAISPDGMITLTLDMTPFRHLEFHIRRIQTNLPSGTSAVIGFSTCTSFPFLSRSFMLAALPFLMRRRTNRSFKGNLEKLDQVPSHPLSTSRKMTPLLTSINRIINLLTTGPSPLVVVSVQNVTKEYTDYLHGKTSDLDDQLRDVHVEMWGMEAWREEKFLRTWEASLFSAELLIRWAVLVRK